MKRFLLITAAMLLSIVTTSAVYARAMNGEDALPDDDILTVGSFFGDDEVDTDHDVPGEYDEGTYDDTINDGEEYAEGTTKDAGEAVKDALKDTAEELFSSENKEKMKEELKEVGGKIADELEKEETRNFIQQALDFIWYWIQKAFWFIIDMFTSLFRGSCTAGTP